MIQSVAYYICEVWLLKRKEQRDFLALEVDYLRRSASAQVKKKKKNSKTAISCKMQAEKSILDRIKRKLKWYGNLLTMEDSRWPKKIYQ